MSKVIAIVPIRHFSQRVPGKNYRPLGNKPLYHYILDNLLQSQIDRVFVDTDSEIVKNGINDLWGTNPRISVLTRPKEVSGPEVSMNKIISSILSRIWDSITDETIILQTHVTNPFLQVDTINRALNEFDQHQPETLLSVNAFQKRIWNQKGAPINHDPDQLLQTQDLVELYEENSCLYIFRVKTMKKYGNRLGNVRHFFRMNQLESWDIDTEEDFNMAQAILKKSQPMNNSSTNLDEKKSKKQLNEKLFDLLNQELKDEINEFLLNNNARYRVLISAPYMMTDIETFQQFYESLGLKVIIAEVEERLSESDLQNYHGKYDIVLCGDDAYTRKTLEDSRVRAICKWGTGIDSLDQYAAKELGVPIYNTPDAFSIPVAQSCLSAILSFARQMQASTDLMRESDAWAKLSGRTIEELTIGIIGLGNVGRKTAEYLHFMGAKIYGYDVAQLPDIPGVIKVDLDTLLENSDMVCTCCTLEPGSFHIIDHQSIKKMRKGSYLINMARGKLVEESAVVDSLNSGHLAGVALDVFEQEPLPKDSSLRHLPNVLLGSHNANSSQKYWNKVHINTIRNSLKAILSFKNKLF